MADWQYHIDLKKVWEDYDGEKIHVVTAGKLVAEILRKFLVTEEITGIEKDEIEEIIFEFEHSSETEEEFDYCMQQLYNWGDVSLPTPRGRMQRKRAWIATNL